MNPRIQLAVVHGRFQPPHNGHIRYILASLERAGHVTIGICTPKLCTPEEAAVSGFPCTADENPFTFAERTDMISAALEAEGIPKNKYSFNEFPSDYVGVGDMFPKDVVFFLSHTGRGDDAKKAHLASLGLTTETVIVLSYEDWRERSGDVRSGLAAGSDEWTRLVPPAVAVYLKARVI